MMETETILAMFVIGCVGLLIGWGLQEECPECGNTQWYCEEGCIYAEWVTYGYRNRTSPSQLYEECSMACWEGDDYFKTKT